MSTTIQRTGATLDPGSYGGTYKLIAGDVTLDFINTLSWRGLPRAHEWLNGYANLVHWACLAGLVSSPQRVTLLKLARKYPQQAQRVVAQAIDLREALNNIVEALTTSKAPSLLQTSHLNKTLSVALQHLQLASNKKRFQWTWTHAKPRLDEVLWHIAWTAGNFLLSPPLHQLRSCETCDWLFLDTTKNHSRKWCTMVDCGNRAKARRHRRRLRSK